MSKPIMKVENLSKMYRLGETKPPFTLLRRKLANGLRKSIGKPTKTANSHQEFWALKDVSFDVQHGDVVGVIGKNGAGKSTLLKILAQITFPTTGKIKIQGKVGSILEVGTGFNPELTGRQNILLNAAILGMHQADTNKQLDKIIDFAGIDQFIDVPVKFYSSGMYARLAFSVVAHLDHEILLIDEVLAVGDAEFQKKCVGKLHGQASSGRTVIFVSHSMASVASLCNRALLITEGTLVLDSSTDHVINTYTEKSHALSSCADYKSPEAAPGNGTVRLKSIRMYDKNGTTKYRHKNSDDIFIAIDYWNIRADARVGSTIVVMDASDSYVFSSVSNHEENWHGKARPVGVYRSTVKIPKDLMKEGLYTLVVLLWADNYTDSYRFDGVAEFEIQDSGVLRGDYFGGWEGAVVPKLDWSCERIDPNV